MLLILLKANIYRDFFPSVISACFLSNFTLNLLWFWDKNPKFLSLAQYWWYQMIHALAKAHKPQPCLFWRAWAKSNFLSDDHQESLLPLLHGKMFGGGLTAVVRAPLFKSVDYTDLSSLEIKVIVQTQVNRMNTMYSTSLYGIV